MRAELLVRHRLWIWIVKLNLLARIEDKLLSEIRDLGCFSQIFILNDKGSGTEHAQDKEFGLWQRKVDLVYPRSSALRRCDCNNDIVFLAHGRNGSLC